MKSIPLPNGIGALRVLPFLLVFLCTVAVNMYAAEPIRSTIHFDLNECHAYLLSETNKDYSEFIGQVTNEEACSQLEVIGGFLYREDPENNPHSCTPGVEGTEAMCFGASSECSYSSENSAPLIIDFSISPGPSGVGTFTGFNFYEQAPETFNWIDGDSGLNNFPTHYAVRVLKNGEEIYLETDINTSGEWTLKEFDFSGLTDFQVTEMTEFTIELSSYCPTGNEGFVSVWDVDEIHVYSECMNVEGGTIEGGPFEFCVGDGDSDFIEEGAVTLTGNVGANSAWVITDDDLNILGLPPMPSDVDFDGAGGGTCLIWHLSLEGDLT
ncbi:MAG: hypothetical protein HKN68_15870, partial [Saprospiraceae bacterium]|nr:hypothetical protein [Saprospiraceae bacterium]